jgi:hypothetical protein
MRLAACPANRTRAAAVADALKAGIELNLSQRFRRDADVAAVHRMRRVLADPRRELTNAVTVLRIAMRRLYAA